MEIKVLQLATLHLKFRRSSYLTGKRHLEREERKAAPVTEVNWDHQRVMLAIDPNPIEKIGTLHRSVELRACEEWHCNMLGDPGCAFLRQEHVEPAVCRECTWEAVAAGRLIYL